MASTNFKLFDENKTNMMSDTEYNINTQRLNGVQAGIASSQLQNKTLHQTSLVAYSLAQIMMQNGYDANDSAAVSAFVGNMSNSLLQKVLDKATSAEAKAGTITNKWISPATMKAAALLLSGGTMSGSINMGNNKITNLADPTADSDAANKKYVNNSQTFKKIQILDKFNTSFGGRKDITVTLPVGFSLDNILNVNFILYELYDVTEVAGGSIGAGMTVSESYELFSSGQNKTFSKITAVVPLSYKYYASGDFYSIFSQKGDRSIRLFSHESGTNNLYFFASSQFSGKISVYFIL